MIVYLAGICIAVEVALSYDQTLKPIATVAMGRQLSIPPFLALKSDHSKIPASTKPATPQLNKKYAQPLRKFILSPESPIKVRQIVRSMTLKPRIVEPDFSESVGFHSCAQLPTALSINKDSRDVVVQLYPVCFGNFMLPPTTRFSMAIDTLLLDDISQPRESQEKEKCKALAQAAFQPSHACSGTPEGGLEECFAVLIL